MAMNRFFRCFCINRFDMALTVPFEPFRFWLRILGNILNRKTIPASMSRRVNFQIRISPRIRRQNSNGSNVTVRDPCRTDLRKNIGKTFSLPCPFKCEVGVHLIAQICNARKSHFPEYFKGGGGLLNENLRVQN
jgi:hypothetical protein